MKVITEPQIIASKEEIATISTLTDNIRQFCKLFSDCDNCPFYHCCNNGGYDIFYTLSEIEDYLQRWSE